MKKYDNGGNYDMLHQEGVIGLIKAIETYDSSKGNIIGHIIYNIRYRIGNHINDLNNIKTVINGIFEFVSTEYDVDVVFPPCSP